MYFILWHKSEPVKLERLKVNFGMAMLLFLVAEQKFLKLQWLQKEQHSQQLR